MSRMIDADALLNEAEYDSNFRYSVQWGWAAKKDGSHWARLPDLCSAGGKEES